MIKYIWQKSNIFYKGQKYILKRVKICSIHNSKFLTSIYVLTSKFLTSIYVLTNRNIDNIGTPLKYIINVPINNDEVLVSFYITSLYKNIPKVDALNIINVLMINLLGNRLSWSIIFTRLNITHFEEKVVGQIFFVRFHLICKWKNKSNLNIYLLTNFILLRKGCNEKQIQSN